MADSHGSVHSSESVNFRPVKHDFEAWSSNHPKKARESLKFCDPIQGIILSGVQGIMERLQSALRAFIHPARQLRPWDGLHPTGHRWSYYNKVSGNLT